MYSNKFSFIFVRSFVLHTKRTIIHSIFGKSHHTGGAKIQKKKRNTTKTLKHDRLFFSTTIKGNKCFLMTEITYKIKFIKATIRWRYFSTNAEMPKTTFFRCLHEPFQTDVGNRKGKKLNNKKYLCEKRVETAMKKKFKKKTKAKFEKWKFNAFPSSKNVKIRGISHKIWNMKIFRRWLSPRHSINLLSLLKLKAKEIETIKKNTSNFVSLKCFWNFFITWLYLLNKFQIKMLNFVWNWDFSI